MVDKRKRSLSSILIVLTIGILVVLVIAFSIFFFNQFRQASITREDNTQNKDIIDTTQKQDYDYNAVTEGILNTTDSMSALSGAVKYSSTKQQLKCHSIKLSKQPGREREYQLDNDYSVSLKISNENANLLMLDFNKSGNIIEDKLFFSDFNDEEPAFTYNFYRIGDYISFTNHDAIDIRSIHLYVIDKQGKLYKDIHEMDLSNEGMAANDIQFIDSSIVMEATRISHGSYIMYNGKFVQSRNEFYSIPLDTPISATYTYTIGNDGNVDFNNPNIVIKETMKDFINKNEKYLDDNYFTN